MNWVKINFDGATFSGTNSANLRAIIRNDKGLVMTAFTQTIPLPTLVEMVEVLATRGDLCFAKELGFDKIIVEGDSEVIIKVINSGGYPYSSFGHIIRDIKLLSSTVRFVVFSHSWRQCNRVAHGLARMACNFDPFQTWMEDVPPGVEEVYCSELVQWYSAPPLSVRGVSQKKKKVCIGREFLILL